MADWTPETAAPIDLCKEWAVELQAVMKCDAYLFGSAIYEGGDQFDAPLSDLYLVIHFSEELDAPECAQRIVTLHGLNLFLKLQMVPRLHRTNCEEPGVSVVAITTFELQANIHKGKTRRF